MTAPSAQETEIREFFEKSIPDQIHLTAIIPDGPTSARDFGTDSTSAIKWALDQNGDGKNDFEDIKIARMKASGAIKDKEEKKVDESIFALTNQWQAYKG